MQSLLLVFFLLTSAESADYCAPTGSRTPCAGTTAEECSSYNCCWEPSQTPNCFFQTPIYYVKEKSNTTFGLTMTLSISDESESGKYPASPISPLQFDIINETSNRLHIKITDPNEQRWEIPENLLPLPPPPTKPIVYADYRYQVPDVGEEFFFAVYRNYYNITIFNTSMAGFIYSNQLLQIGSAVPSTTSVYGLGEHKTSLRLNRDQKQMLTLWNYDGGTPDNLNLYGSHPFYLAMEQSGSAHGVFLRNSNGMDIELDSDSIKYNVIGGILDFYFLLGSSPDEVISQYFEVIGRPAMPPYWALGFHQCRYGYKNLQVVQDVVKSYARYEIPLDTMWTDIDYMDGFKDFTTDPTNFPTAGMRNFIDDLHMKGQHYVVIVDPGISNTVGYKPYDDGVSMDIFVKDRDNKIFIGEVWPGHTAFPDFSYSLTTEYWTKQIAAFVDQVPVDGLWLDMNEPSSRCNGVCSNTTSSSMSFEAKAGRIRQNFDPAKPPYTIANRKHAGGDAYPLNQKTFDMDAKHHSGAMAYDMHNLYGLTESMATRKALLSIKQGKRPFVLSRSTFPGSGAHAAHWLGDDTSSTEDLHLSISTILSFQMFGVPLVGADICGFREDTTEELCARWMELGSFYPFARNHDSIHSKSQEPYLWPSVAAISRKYLAIRYSLLPYYYTLFYGISLDKYSSATSVLRPLFYEFFDDKSLGVDTEFMLGRGLLVAPQLSVGDEGKSLNIYLPQSVWYDWYTHELATDGLPVEKVVQTPLDHMPIYIRGGSIIPMQGPGLTTTESRKNPYSLIVALSTGYAYGYLYLDDGETYNTTEYTYISYSCQSTQLSGSVSGTQYATKAGLPTLQNVTILGLLSKPTVVALNGVPHNFTFFEGITFKMVLTDLNINMDKDFDLNWM